MLFNYLNECKKLNNVGHLITISVGLFLFQTNKVTHKKITYFSNFLNEVDAGGSRYKFKETIFLVF